MPLKNYICPDNGRILVADCLKEGGCRMKDRCATKSYLRLASKERVWTGKASTTQCIAGTMNAFLKLTNEFDISPDSRAFMLHGTIAHAVLEASEDENSELERKFTQGNVSGIADNIETEEGRRILVDYKTSGSFKITKALGMWIDKEEVDDGVYKTGKKKGEPKIKTVRTLKRDDEHIDRWEWELQLNKYRMEYEKETGDKIDGIKIQCCARDGGCYIAHSRGVFRNVYYFYINRIDDEIITEYFDRKRKALMQALEQGYWNETCNEAENWGGIKCARYCEVAEYCSLGKYLKQEKKEEEMSIKGLSEIRRLPRLGKIRLGIKKKKAGGAEYPAEVDYFILDPSTPDEKRNKALKDEFHRLYGEQPKSINIMFPMNDTDVIFPQWYKRYGTFTLLQCKGDGKTATCSSEEFAKDLEVTGKTEMGLPVVKCEGRQCPYYDKKKCTEVATLQVLLPELKGLGVWQINTGSYHSIVNINSNLAMIKDISKASLGYERIHMIPMKLTRQEQAIQFEGKKRIHYILNLDTDIKLGDFYKLINQKPGESMAEALVDKVNEEDQMIIEKETPELERESYKDREKKNDTPEEIPAEVVEEVEKKGDIESLRAEAMSLVNKLIKTGKWTSKDFTHIVGSKGDKLTTEQWQEKIMDLESAMQKAK